MKIEDLEFFVSAAESEVFFTANGDAHRFQSSAAAPILALEKEFHTLLFLREGKNSGILTEAGKTLLRNAKPLVLQYRRALRAMDQYREKDERAIIIGSLPILKQYRLSRLFNRFVDDYDDLDFRIEESEGKNLIAGLNDGYYDAIIIRANMINDPNVEMCRLAADEMAAILWDTHPLAKEQSIRLEKLKNEFFYLTNPYTPSYGLCWKLLKDHHISTENVITAEVRDILPAISNKQGVGLLPMSNIASSRQPGVVAVPLEPRAMLEVVFAFRKDIEQSTYMKDLIEMIRVRASAVPV